MRRVGLVDTLKPQRINELLPRCMEDHGVDMWILFTREGAVDPLAFDVGFERVVARSAAIFIRKGKTFRKTAIVGTYDVESIKSQELYDEVIGYAAEGVAPALKKIIDEVQPEVIALNYSRDLPTSDGLTHGNWTFLSEVFGEEILGRVVSAEPLVVSFRGKKLPTEVALLEQLAIMCQDVIREALSPRTIVPGVTRERDIAEFMDRKISEMGYEYYAIHVSGSVSRGHAEPTDELINPGSLVRINLSGENQGYICDIQRTAYVRRRGETEVPEVISRMWATTLAANRAGLAVVSPGIPATEIDAAARKIIVDAGFDEYPHAGGHPIGRTVHDVGPIIGPDWPERYGSTVWHKIEVDQVFAIEPTIYSEIDWIGGMVEIALEENFVVEEEGARVFGTPQEELIVL